MFARIVPVVVVVAVVLLLVLQVIGCLDMYLHAAPQRALPPPAPQDVNPGA